MTLSQVFSEHRCKDDCDLRWINEIYGGCWRFYPCPKLLAEIEAARPVRTLDRESVRNILFSNSIAVSVIDNASRLTIDSDKFIDAICSLALPEAPEPSREELEKIAIGYEIKNVAEAGHGGFGNMFPPEMAKKLMSWASRKAEVKWCEHIQKWSGGTLTHKSGAVVRDDWDICPIKDCHKPRPTQGER